MDIGFNFRSTSGYVTDGAAQTFFQTTPDSTKYPCSYTINGTTLNAGWTTGVANWDAPVQDVNNTVDARLAGIAYSDPGATYSLRIDLPSAGTYAIRLAFGGTATGRSGFVGQNQVLVIKDNTTAKLSFSQDGVDAGNFLDATGTSRTQAGWVANNVAVNVVFASTTLNLDLGGASGGYTTLSTLQVTGPAAVGGGAAIVVPYGRRTGMVIGV